MDTESKTAKLIIGIKAEEWNRRHAAVREELEHPEGLTDDRYRALKRENTELRKLRPIFVREAGTTYRIASAFKADAVLVKPDATTVEEADQLTSEYDKKIDQGMKKHGLAAKIEELWRYIFRRKRWTDPLKDAIREAESRLDSPHTQEHIVEMTDCVLKERKIKLSKACPKEWLPIRSLTEAFKEPTLEGRIKTFITRALNEKDVR